MISCLQVLFIWYFIFSNTLFLIGFLKQLFYSPLAGEYFFVLKTRFFLYNYLQRVKEEKAVQFENAKFEYYVDYVEKRIHIKDHESAHTYSVMNQISPDFQKWLVREEELLIDVLEFDWYLYTGNDIVARWSDYTFKFITPTESSVYKPYLKNKAK
jgi:hypothetical protein